METDSLSKPTTDISSGTLIPKLLAAFTAATVYISLTAKIAFGLFRPCEIFSVN